MFALRRAAIAAPRTIARSLTTSTRQTLLIAPRSSLTRIQLPRTAIKAFSTTRAHLDSASQTLAAKLQNELQLESETNEGTSTQSDENVQKFLDARDWELTENEGEQYVKLTRKYDDETIEVAFSIADFPAPYAEEDVDDALLDEEDLDMANASDNAQGRGNKNLDAAAERGDIDGAEDDLAGSQTPFAVNATVTIRRDGKPGALRIELVAEDGEFSIHSIAQLASNEAASSINPLLPAGIDKHYTGPPFQQLDEELQGFFESYLDERGIDEALALFIPDYIDVKEQREYLAWLKRVKDFVE